jgi:outer membrane protein OmpA-like peptidoglycan-associated protein
MQYFSTKTIQLLTLCALGLLLTACASRQTNYRFSREQEPFCNQTKQFKHRQTPPIKYFFDDHSSRILFFRRNDRNYLIRQLSRYNMEFIQYRDIITVIVPVDQYFEFDSAKLDERNYAGLNNLVSLIYLSPCTTVHVAAFADNVGTREYNNKLTQAQAEAMLTYFWANGIPADNLNAQGFGTRFAIGDNNTTRGSAYNRRIEVQWTIHPDESIKNIDLSMK